MKPGLSFSSLAAVWLALAGAGYGALALYQATPSASQSPPAAFPRQSAIAPAPGIPTLVTFVHPRCPCSRATVDSVAWLMTRLRGKLNAHVAILTPDGAPADWEKTDIWRSARRIKGVTVFSDQAGREAALFGATISGEVALYGADGSLLYHGGITAGRGHHGDNVGRSAVLSLAAGRTAEHARASAFGCALFASEAGGAVR